MKQKRGHWFFRDKRGRLVKGIDKSKIEELYKKEYGDKPERYSIDRDTEVPEELSTTGRKEVSRTFGRNTDTQSDSHNQRGKQS